jgi:hypothetical protein
MIGATPARVGPHLKLNRSAIVSHYVRKVSDADVGTDILEYLSGMEWLEEIVAIEESRRTSYEGLQR